MIPKSRVWSKVEKRWLDPKDHFVDGDGNLWYSTEEHTVDGVTRHKIALWPDMDSVVVCRSTGRKDMNGVEMHEGNIIKRIQPEYMVDSDCAKARENKECLDIKDGKRTGKLYEACPKCPHSLTDTGRIAFYSRPLCCGFHIEEISIESRFGFNGPEGPEFAWDELEVIGNKFENPELMKPQINTDEHR